MKIKKRFLVLGLIIILLAGIQFWALLARPRIAVNSQILPELLDRAELITPATESVATIALAADRNPEKQPLKLELIGTALGNLKDPIAFIKDLESGVEAIYKTGNKVKEAQIIRIAKGEVELERNGVKETLKLRRWQNNPLENHPAIASIDGDNIVMNKAALLKQVGNLIQSAKKAQVEPYTVAKKVIGMKIEGLTKDNLITQVGIHNKDIVTTVNNQKIDSYQKALQVFSKVKNQAEIKVSLLRDGEIKNLNYRFNN